MQTAAEAPHAGRLNQNHLRDGKKDPARGRPLVRMTVHNRETLVLALPGANLIDPGTHEIECYDDDVEPIRAMVEDPQMIAQAERQYAIDIAEEVGKSLDHPWPGSADDLARIIASKSDPAINAAYAKISATTGLSKQGAFQKLFKRAMKPLSMAELIANSEHPEHQRAGTQREVEKQAEAFASALRSVAKELVAELRGGNASEDAIAAIVDARVKDLLGEVKAPKR